MLQQDTAGIYTTGKNYQLDYPEKGNEDYLKFEEQSFWFRHRNNVIINALKKIGAADNNIADVGGGNGLQAKFLQQNFPNINIALIEPGYAGCLAAKNRGVQEVYNCLFQEFDFEQFGASTVGLFDVIEHIEDDTAFLKEIKGKLKPGDVIIITTPAYNWLWSEMDDYARHHRRYTKTMLKKLAVSAGLKLKYSSYFFSFLWPLTLLVRVLPYKLGRRRSDEELMADEKQQHTSPGLVGAVMSFFCKIELSILKRISLPVGGSLVAVFEV